VLLQNIHAMSVSNKNQRVKIIEPPRISEILASSTNPSETEETMSATQTTPVVLEPAAQDFADATANPPYLFDLGPDKGRETVDEAQSAEIDRPDVEIEGRSVAGGPGGDVSVRTRRPNLTDGDLPVILYTHDAGWVFGNAHTHDRLIRELTHGTGAALVFPNYSLSPEARYPTAIEEIYAVLAWIANDGANHGLDPSRIAVAGDSVGGNMSASVTLMAKQRSGPELAAQVLFYPVTDARFDTDSCHQEVVRKFVEV
jgi:acetyl esterase